MKYELFAFLTRYEYLIRDVEYPTKSVKSYCTYPEKFCGHWPFFPSPALPLLLQLQQPLQLLPMLLLLLLLLLPFLLLLLPLLLLQLLLLRFL